MIHTDSFGRYNNDDGLLLAWDDVQKTGETVISYVSTTDPRAGGQGLSVTGGYCYLTKDFDVRYNTLFIALRAKIQDTLKVVFLFDRHILGYIKLSWGGAVLEVFDRDDVRVKFLSLPTANDVRHWEFRMFTAASGDVSVYENGILVTEAYGNFLNVGNAINGFRIELEDTEISDLCVDYQQIGQKSVSCYFPLADVRASWDADAGDHFEKLNNLPHDLSESITAVYGEAEVLRYEVDTLDMASIHALALVPLVVKDIGADETGLGMEGVEYVGTTVFTFNRIFPTSDLKARHIITKVKPSTGSSLLPGDLESINLGLIVEYA